MPDKITQLLDQIDRLDQEATKGPWDHTVEWAEIGSGSDSVIHGYGYAHCDGCDEEIEGVDSRVALSQEDAEFIALARTALPQLAKALKAVMELHKPAELYPAVTPGVIYCYSCWDSVQDEALEYPCDTYQTITDAMNGADGD